MLQELDETDYWLDLLLKAKIVPAEKLEPLIQETNELIAIFVAKIKARMANEKMKAKR